MTIKSSQRSFEDIAERTEDGSYTISYTKYKKLQRRTRYGLASSLMMIIIAAFVISAYFPKFPGRVPKLTQAATTYYVDVINGKDSNDGSSGNPWQTITHALDFSNSGLAVGDTIIVRDGTYNDLETFGLLIPFNLTIQSENGPSSTTIVADGNGEAAFGLSDSVTNVTISGFTIIASGDGGAAIQLVDFSTEGSSGITVSNNVITCNGAGNIGIEYGPASGTIQNNIIYNCPNNGAINITQGANSNPPDLSVNILNNTLDNNKVGIILTGLDQKSPTVTIRNNIITNNASYGIISDGGILVNASYNNVFGNIDNNYNGINAPSTDIQQDPLYTDSSNANFTLQSTSPSIDAGDPNDTFSTEPTPNGCRINQGAFGNTTRSATTAGGSSTCDYFVATTGSNDNDGRSAETPFKTITYALSQIDPNITARINVAAGTYDANNGETFALQPPSNITLQGADASTTIIEATLENNVRPSTFDLSSGNNITISGFTIQGDGGNWDGIFIGNEVENITISNNIFRNNYYSGVQIFGNGTNITISNNTFYSMGGNGIRIAASDTNSRPGTVTVQNNLIYSNGGNGIDVQDVSNLTIINNTINANSQSGILVNENLFIPTVAIKNNIITNHSPGAGIAIYDGTISLNYNNIWNNGTDGTLNYLGISAASTDISLDPIFASTESGSEDFSLQSTSPSIDAGDPNDNCSNEPVLAVGNSCIIDQGAYGNTSSGNYANPGGAEKIIDIVPPAHVQNIHIAYDNECRPVLKWENSTDADFAMIKILRGAKGKPISGVPYMTLSKDKTSFIDTDIEIGQEYKYMVRAIDTSGNQTTNEEVVTFYPIRPTPLENLEIKESLVDGYVLSFNPILNPDLSLDIRYWKKAKINEGNFHKANRYNLDPDEDLSDGEITLSGLNEDTFYGLGIKVKKSECLVSDLATVEGKTIDNTAPGALENPKLIQIIR